MNESITSFRGEYSFLSNFHPWPVEYQGITYPTNEHAFQAAKTHDYIERTVIARLSSPREAKAYGRKVELRSDWEDVKVSIMETICENKFRSNPDFAQKLIDTGDAYIEESNRHGDTYWGTVNGVGRNELGLALMRVRMRLQDHGGR